MLLLLQWVNRAPQDVVLELTERETVLDPGRMANVLAQYRAEGFRFAVDDLGKGRSGMEVVAAAMPEYIKVARRLVRDDTLGSNAMIEAAVAFARRTGAAAGRNRRCRRRRARGARCRRPSAGVSGQSAGLEEQADVIAVRGRLPFTRPGLEATRWPFRVCKIGLFK